MYVPPPPEFSPLRLACPSDILRLGIVCTAGFRYSEQFIYERAYHQDYPEDTIVFFRHEVEEFIRSTKHIVLVAYDQYQPDESSKTEAIIPVDNGWLPPEAGASTIVGLAVWKLEPGSKRVGHFQNEHGTYPHLSKYLGRDLNQKRADSIADVAAAAELRYLQKFSIMERTVVHPAYWNRGHGTMLTQWGISLATLDRVDQGVLATSLGSSLFRHCGFGYITTVHVDGDDRDTDGVDLDVLRYHVAS